MQRGDGLRWGNGLCKKLLQFDAMPRHDLEPRSQGAD